MEKKVLLSFIIFLFCMTVCALAIVNGDIDGNGVLEENDVILVKKQIAGLEKVSSEQLELMDVNNDGRVTATDISLLRKKINESKSPESINLNYDYITIDLNENNTFQLETKILPSDANVNTDIKWISQDEKIVIVDGTGKVTALSAGTTFVTAETSNGVSANCKIIVISKVNDIFPESVSLNNNNLELDLNNTKEIDLTAAILPANANKATNIHWESSDENIAVVNSTGRVTLIKEGQVTITARTENDKSTSCFIKAIQPKIEEVKEDIYPSSISLNTTFLTLSLVEEAVQLNSKILPSNANIETDISWTTSNPNIATVSNSGIVTPIRAGITNITATTQNGKSATCTILVKQKPKFAESITPAKVQINKTDITLDLNGVKKESLIATIFPQYANTYTEITWTSTNPSVASVDFTGKVIAQSVGTTIIKATTRNNVVGECIVTVTEAPEEIEVESIKLNPNYLELDLNGKKEETLTASFDPLNANARKEITWSVKGENPSAVSVEETGDFTVKVTAKSVGKATIIATTENGVSTSCEVNVNESTVSIYPTEIILEPKSLELDLTGIKAQTLKASFIPSDANAGKEITWESSNPTVASVDAEGKVTAKSVGAATITVRTENGASASCEVKVSESIAIIYPTSIKLNNNSLELDINGTKIQTLTASFDPLNANAGKEITWSVKGENPSAVSVEKIGDFTVKVTALKKGKATIIATTQNENGNEISASCEVNVSESIAIIYPTSIKLDNNSLELDINGTKIQTLTASFDPLNANAGKEITWSVKGENPSAVSVEKIGDFTVKVTALKKGKATIIATTQNENGNEISASCEVKVSESIAIIYPTSIKLDNNSLELDINGTKIQTLTASFDPLNANAGKEITWSVKGENPNAVSVEKTGDFTVKVTALKKGKATIIATTQNENGNEISASCEVNVSESIAIIYPTNIKLNDSSLELDVNRANQKTLTVIFEPLNANAGKEITWSVKGENPNAVSVEKTGDFTVKVIANYVGKAIIRATTENGKFAECNVTVTNYPTSITLNPNSLELYLKETKTLNIQPTPRSANIGENIIWTSSNTSVVSVNGQGEITAKAKGNAKITATVKDKNGNVVAMADCTVEVKEPSANALVSYGSFNEESLFKYTNESNDTNYTFMYCNGPENLLTENFYKNEKLYPNDNCPWDGVMLANQGFIRNGYNIISFSHLLMAMIDPKTGEVIEPYHKINVNENTTYGAVVELYNRSNKEKLKIKLYGASCTDSSMQFWQVDKIASVIGKLYQNNTVTYYISNKDGTFTNNNDVVTVR